MSAATAHRLGPYAGQGRVFEVEVDDRGLGELLADLLAPLTVHAGAEPTATFTVHVAAGGTGGTVLRDGTVVASASTRGLLLMLLQQRINHHVIAAAEDRLLFHAAAAVRDGRALVLPADMEAGKTTLVSGLLSRGWSYLTDEAAAVTSDGRVVGYHKPLSIDPGSWEVLPWLAPDGPARDAGWFDEQWQVVPPRLAETAPIGLVVFPRYEAGAVTELTPLTPGEAVERAVPCTFVTDRTHIATSTVRQLADLFTVTPARGLVVGDLDAACDLIEAAFADAIRGARP